MNAELTNDLLQISTGLNCAADMARKLSERPLSYIALAHLNVVRSSIGQASRQLGLVLRAIEAVDEAACAAQSGRD